MKFQPSHLSGKTSSSYGTLIGKQTEKERVWTVAVLLVVAGGSFYWLNKVAARQPHAV